MKYSENWFEDALFMDAYVDSIFPEVNDLTKDIFKDICHQLAMLKIWIDGVNTHRKQGRDPK